MERSLLKKVLSIFIIITMLINILPNFSLLSNTVQASEGTTQGLVLKKVSYDESDKIIEIGLYIRYMKVYGIELDMCYPSEMLEPINKTYEDRKKFIETGRNNGMDESQILNMANMMYTINTTNDVTKLYITNDTITGIPLYSASELNDGDIYTVLSASSGKNETFNSEEDITQLLKAYFRIKDGYTIDDIKPEMFGLKDGTSFEIMSSTNETTVDRSLFAVEGFGDSAPTITSIEVVEDPTDKITYVHGAEVDLTGLKLTVNYSDGTKIENVTIGDKNLTVTPEGTITANIKNNEISFEYSGQPDTVGPAKIELSVIDPVAELVVNDPNNVLKESYSHGKDISVGDITITPITVSGDPLEDITLPDSKIEMNPTVAKADMMAIENPSIDESTGLYSGMQKITFTYTNEAVEGTLVGEFEETVVAEAPIMVNDEIHSIAISEENPPIAEYTLNDSFQKNGNIVVKGKSNKLPYGEIAINSTNVTVQQERKDGTLGPVDLSEPGTKTLVVEYMGQTATYPITVADPVDHIEITPSTKEVSYNTEFADISLNGITVTVVRKSGARDTSVALQRNWVDSTGYDKTVAGPQELDVNYEVEDTVLTGKLIIDVQDALLGITIDTEGMKTEYEYGEDFDITGATITLNYASGDEGPYPLNPGDVEVDGYDKKTAGEQTVTITYEDTDNGETATAEIKVTVVNSAKEIRATLNKAYASGSPIPATDVVAKLWRTSDFYKVENGEDPAPETTTDITLSTTTAAGTGVQTITVTYTKDNKLTDTVKALVLPTGLTAIYGDKLSTVGLPDGFKWEYKDTEVGPEGDNPHTVEYIKNDYEGTKTGLEVTVTVSKKGATVPKTLEVKAYEGDKLKDVNLEEIKPSEFSNGTLEWSEETKLKLEKFVYDLRNSEDLKAIYTDNDKNITPAEVKIILDVETIKRLKVTLGKEGYASNETFNIENTVNKVEAIYDEAGTITREVTEYTVSIATGDELSAGVNTAIVTYEAESGTKTANVQVLRLPEKKTIAYEKEKTLNDFPIGNGFEWVKPEKPIARGESEELIYFIVPAGTDFNGVEAGTPITELPGLDKLYINVEVTKGILSEDDIPWPTGLKGIDGQTLSTIDLEEINDNTADGNFEWVDPDDKLKVNTNAYRMKYTPDDENYDPIEKNVDVTVEPIGIHAIIVRKAPDKVEYVKGESLLKDGIEVVGIQNNSEEIDITERVEINSNGPLSFVGINTISVSYPRNDKDGNPIEPLTATFNVLVLPTGLTATYGDKLSTVGLTSGFAWSNSYEEDKTVGNATTGEETNDFSVKYTIPLNTTLKINGVEYTEGETYYPTAQVGIKVAKATLVKEDLEYTKVADKDYDKDGEGTEVKVDVVKVNGEPKTNGKVTVTVYDEEGNIAPNPKNAGTYTVTVSVEEGDNYTGLEVPILYTFTINKINPTFTVPTGLTATYGDTLANVDLSGFNTEDGDFAWQEANTTSVGNAGDRIHKVTYTPKDTTNYNVVKDIEVTITVAEAAPVVPEIEELTAEYGTTLAEVDLSGFNTENGDFAWVEPPLTKVGEIGPQKHQVKFTPKDGNYETVIKDVIIVVTQATPAYTLPEDLESEYGTTLADVGLPKGFTWEKPTESVGNVGQQKHKVTFTPEDTVHYKTVTGLEVTIEVEKATITLDDLVYDLPAPREYNKETATTVSVTSSVTDGEITVTYYDEKGNPVTNPTDAGTYTVKVKVAEGTNHKALDEFKEVELGNFVIEQADVSVTVGKQTIEYNPDNKLANVTLPTVEGGTLEWIGGTTLLGGVGEKTYQAKFTPNNANYKATNVSVIVEVTPATPVVPEIEELEATYGDTLAKVNLSSFNTEDGDFTWNEALTTPVGNAGKQTHTVTFTPNDNNYKPVEKDVTVNVKRAPITINDVKNCDMPSSRPYDGTPTQFTNAYVDKTDGQLIVKVYDKDNNVVPNPTDAGTYTVTVEVKQGTNYEGLTETTVGNFTITKADLTVTVEKQTIEYNRDNTLADVKLPKPANGTLTWVEDGTTELGGVGEKTYHAKFTPDNANYNEIASVDVVVEVTQATPDYTIPTELTVIEGQTLKEVQGLPDGFAWEEELITPIPLVSVGGTKYRTTVTFTPDDTTNYKIVENIPVEITVIENEIDHIEIVTRPNTIDYIEGQVFDPEGMVVRAHYTDGTSSDISGYTIDNADKKLEIGDIPITVRYKDDHTATFTIKVKADSVLGIEVKAPDKLEYKYNEELDLTGGTVKKVMASGVEQTAEALTSDMISGYDKTTLGKQNITVKYAGVSETNAFQVDVKDYVTGISIKNPGDLKTAYLYGEEIVVKDKEDSSKAIYIQVDYAGGTPSTPVELTKSMLSGFDMTSLGGQQVTVTYEGMTTKYPINVSDYVKDIAIVKEPTKKVYKLGETLDTTGLVVRNFMASDEKTGIASGSDLSSSDYTVSALDSSTTGGKTITVTKAGTTFTDTFNIVVIDPVSDMQINELPKTEYTFGESLSLTGGSIIVKTENDETGRIIPMTDPSVKVTGYSSNSLGKQNLTVTYTYEENVDSEDGIITETKTMTANYSVNVEDDWSGQISVVKPTKVTYSYGEDLNLAGGTVSKLMLSGAVEDTTELTGAMVSGYNPTTVGTQYITVTHWGKTTGFNVTVIDKTYGISINTLPDKTVYNQGENLDLTGATINVTKDSGIKQIPVTPDMVTGYDPNKVGDQLITINYDGYTAKFVVTVNKVETPSKPTKPSTPSKPTKPTTPSKPTTTTKPEEKQEYLVTFVDYDGRILKTESVQAGKAATAPITPYRDQYIFDKWDVEFDNITSDLTVKATYKVDENKKMVVEGLKKEYEPGEEIDLDDVTVKIATGDGVITVPVTEDMIEYMDNESVETRTIIVTYTDENGEEYVKVIAAKLKKPHEFKQEVLGVQDEEKDNNNNNDILIPAAIGAGVTGALLLLLGLINRKNVEIYALREDRRKLIGKEKISKNDAKISLYEYEEQLTAADAEILIKERMSKKLDGEYVEVAYDGKKATYKVKAEEGEDFTIIIRRKEEEQEKEV